MTPTVSVLICLHNSSPFIVETLATVFAQTSPPSEIIVIDDGSTDGCADLVERQFDDPRLRVIRQPHRGLGAARQRSVDEASAEYVAFLDHDDLWLPHKLDRQLAIVTAERDLGLIFSDCFLIDAAGHEIGRLSDRFDYPSINIDGSDPLGHLLVHGCFIDLSTVVARTQAVMSAGGFNARYTYVEDYDLWLRIARRWRLRFVREPLAKRRLHDGQFTRRRPDVALSEQVQLLRPVADGASFPPDVRRAVHHYLFGQHLECGRRLAVQGNWAAAGRAALSMRRYPRPLADFCWSHFRQTALGRRIRPLARRLRAPLGAIRQPYGPDATVDSGGTPIDVWVDGSALDQSQTGYFNLTVELLRSLVRWRPHADSRIHVVTTRAGVAPLRERLGADGSMLHVHVPEVRDILAGRLRDALCRWRPGPIRQLLRLAHRRLAAPRGDGGAPALELLVWRGRFRYAASRKIALVQDLTPRIGPEWHTDDNVRDFEEYLGYALRHAETIATVSEHSRRDIIDSLAVFPRAVHVVPMRVHPIFEHPRFERGVLARHRVESPYVLCVGTREPRKNLRRLLRAFELLARTPVASEHVLLLVGPAGWDETFDGALAENAFRDRIRMTGFVPLEDLPSLYHFASVVIYPSLYEGFGLPVLEAMCSSAIVATSRVSAMPEILGSSGMYFDPHDVEDIASVLTTVLQWSPTDAAPCRRRCRSRGEALLAQWAAEPPLPGL